MTLPGEAVDLERLAIDDIDVTAFIDGGKVAASVVRHGETVTVFMDGQTFAWTIPDPLEAADDGGFIAGDQLRAPMPGLIKLVQVGAGDRVAKGGPLLVMEAMKMEHTLKAPRDGVVGQCLVAVGDQVDDGALLLELQPDQKDDGPAE